ncbi:MAG: DNA translocase FtsK 4TM domain-containing protein, partial [Clostridiales bacterium]|nr:DNA translocase FtsK 4TM domain-containing protein [Clostridiales bacterium]
MAPSRKKTAAKKEANIRAELRRDILAIAMFSAGVFIAFCLWRTPAEGTGNGIGAIGYGVYQSCQFLFGQGKWFPVAALLLLGGGAWLKAIYPGRILIGAYAALILSGCAMLHLRLPNAEQFLSYGMQGLGGGLVGGGLLQASNLLIGQTGSWILYLSLAAASVLLITGKTIRELLDGASGGARKIRQSAQDGLSMLYSNRQAKRQTSETGVLQSLNLPIETELRQDKQNTTAGRSIPFRDYTGNPANKTAAQTSSPVGNASADTTGAGNPANEKPGSTAVKNRREKDEDNDFLPEKRQVDGEQAKAFTKRRRSYRLPSIQLLRTTPPLNSQRQNKVLADHVRILEKTLADFNLQATVTQVNKGPSITRFELQPAPGVKVSRIVGLSDDIALALAAAHIRIEAPIPGKAAIGIEVPNAERALVSLREILEDPAFKQSSSKLSFALGRDIAGASIIADLARMPHLLIAGATGSGKSVCINA